MDEQRNCRLPLTVRQARGFSPSLCRIDRSKQRTYGKRGSSAASRALLRDNFVDENTIDDIFAELSLRDQAASPSELPNGQEIGKDKKTRPRALFHGNVEKHQRARSVDTQAAEYVSPLLSQSRSSKGLTSFETWADRLSRIFKVLKIAEGSFGEVFKLQEKCPCKDMKSATLDEYGGCILKIVPLNARSGPGSKKYSAVAKVIREVELLKKLDEVAGFTRFREVHVVQGKYPPAFIDAFRDFKDRGKDCQNEDPQKFSPTQLYAVIEMDDAGEDLEQLRRPSAFQIYDIFWSIVMLLANAEDEVEYEHRDLHVGNICIKPWAPGGSLDISREVNSSMKVLPKSLLGLSGIRTTIIDYTISRARLDMEKPNVAYDPMKDSNMFNSQGKTFEERHQFEAYRHMRTCIDGAEAHALETRLKLKKSSVQKWSRFVPRTNVIWLRYILHVLLYRADQHRLADSCTFSEALQVGMYADFARVIRLLEKETSLQPNSAKHLLFLAEENGWLHSEDIRLFKQRLAEDT